MKILFIANKDPRLTNGGNEQRTHLLWEALKHQGEVFAFISDRKMGTYAERIEGEHPIYKYRPEEKRNILWSLVNAMLCRFSLFCVFGRKITKMPDPQKAYEGVKFDFVVARYLYPVCEYEYWKIAPLLIDIDDHPLQVYETVRRKRLPIGLKTIGAIVTKWQARYIISKSVGGWIANEEQVDNCGENYRFLPNIPQTPSEDYKIDNPQRVNLFTVGAMGYVPNKDGVSRFLREIWPAFHQKYPNVKYYIAGKGASEEEIKRWNSTMGVEYLGFVENLEALYEKTLATVVPIYSGGGTCIKTLESLSFSRICLSTKFGARGLKEDLLDGTNGLMIFEDAQSFISQYENIQNSESRSLMEKRGRKFVRDQYSKNAFEESVEKIVDHLI